MTKSTKFEIKAPSVYAAAIKALESRKPCYDSAFEAFWKEYGGADPIPFVDSQQGIAYLEDDKEYYTNMRKLKKALEVSTIIYEANELL